MIRKKNNRIMYGEEKKMIIKLWKQICCISDEIIKGGGEGTKKYLIKHLWGKCV